MKALHSIYFIGIGGIGMSALARYFHAQGVEVKGYDRTATQLTDALQQEGIAINFVDDPELVSANPDLVVYTPAIPASCKQLDFCRKKGFSFLKRAAVLGEITKQTRTLAVAGTHGKTTTSSMIAHIMHTAKTNATAFLGGIATNYNSNLVLSKNSDTTVVEADEFDRSFLTLHPDLAIITSMDADHLDIYGASDALQESFTEFAEQVKSGGKLILRKGLQLKRDVACETIGYALEQKADYFATNVKLENGRYVFDLESPEGAIPAIKMGIPGRHNAENAVAAIAITQQAGVEPGIIREALESFQGIKRRFEYVIDSEDIVFIDDYAHHPEELRACIESVREMYPDKKITGIFQPHLFTRTRDFADGFAKSLDLLDETILLPIYPARELPIEGVSSEMLLKRMQKQQKNKVEKEHLINELKSRQLEVLLTLGAGDIDQLVKPIKELLTA